MASTPKQKRKMEFWTLGGCDQSQSFESPQSLNLKVNSTEPVVAKGGEEPWFSQNKRNWKKFFEKMNNKAFFWTFAKIWACHLLANVLIFFKITIQDFYNEYCWMGDVCSCNNEFSPKLYSALNEVICYWFIIINSIAYSTLFYKLIYGNTIISFIFYCGSFLTNHALFLNNSRKKISKFIYVFYDSRVGLFCSFL